MKNRLFTILMVLLFLSLACTNSSDKEETSPVIESTMETEIEKTESSDSETAESNVPAEPTQVPEVILEPTPFEEIVVVDNSEVLIKITGLNPNAFLGYEVNAYLENKSAIKTYMFAILDASINGVKVDPFYATEIAPGKKEIGSITFPTSVLEDNGVTEFTDIEILFHAYDTDDWLADDVANETVNIYPYGLEKAVPFVRETKTTDYVVVDNEYVTLIVIGYEDDPIWGFTANLFLVNKSDKEVMFSVSEASVNGFMVDPFYANSLFPGKVSFSSMSWSDSSLEEQGITEIEEIEFTLRVYDVNDFMANDLVNQIVILDPN